MLTPWKRLTVHLAAAVVSTWPLVAKWGTGLPLGGEPVATVPYFNLWSLRWTAHMLPQHFVAWWDAPIFAPLTGTYARSELQPLTGLVYGVLDRVVPATVAYGLLIIGALLLDGLAGNALARRLGAGERAAAVAGVLVQTVPFLFQQLGVIQLLMIWPVLLVADQLLGWAESPTLRRSVAAGLAGAAAFLTCSYHAALFAMAAAVGAPLLVRRSWVGEWRRRVGTAAVGVTTLSVLVAPFAIGQQRRLSDAAWTDATIREGSSSWHDLGPWGTNWPGLALLTLAVAGVAVGRRTRDTWFIVSLATIAVFMAGGLRLSVNGWHPYETLIDHVGVVARLRSPFRAIALTQVLLAVLAAPAVDAMRRYGRVRWLAVATLVLASVMNPTLGPGRIVSLPDSSTSWMSWLDRHQGGAVAMMPMPVTRPVEAFEPTAGWMLLGLDHGHPLLNGYTGFFPPGDRDMRLRMAKFPDTSTVAELRQRGVRYVVADPLWWTSELQRAATQLGLVVVSAGPDGTVLDLGDGR